MAPSVNISAGASATFAADLDRDLRGAGVPSGVRLTPSARIRALLDTTMTDHEIADCVGSDAGYVACVRHRHLHGRRR